MSYNHEREKQAFFFTVGELLRMGYAIKSLSEAELRATFRSQNGDFLVKPLDSNNGTLMLLGDNISPQAPKEYRDSLILPTGGTYATQARTLLLQTKPPTGLDVLSNLVFYVLLYGKKTSTTIDVYHSPDNGVDVYIMAYGVIHKFKIHNPTSKSSTPLTNIKGTVNLTTPQEIVTWAVSQQY